MKIFIFFSELLYLFSISHLINLKQKKTALRGCFFFVRIIFPIDTACQGLQAPAVS